MNSTVTPETTEARKARKAARRAVVLGVLSGLMFAGYALYLSRDHITFCGYAARLKPLEAETLFIFIDFVAIFGKVLRNKHLTARTRRIGAKWMIGGGAASLVCNVMAGVLQGNYGEAVYGAILVAMIAGLEYTIANTKAKATGTTKRTRRTAPVATPALPIPTVRISGTGRTCQVGCTCKRHPANRPVLVNVAP